MHMRLMSWTIDLSVGVDSIDAQHQKLVDLLNQMHDARLNGAPKATSGKLLTEALHLPLIAAQHHH
jgi:hemerythrin